MTKQVLIDYIDACEQVEETKKDLERLRRNRKNVVIGSVKGSNPDFPYQEQHFKISGTSFGYSDDLRMRSQETALVARTQVAERIKLDVEEWLQTIPLRMQRIIRYKIFDGLSWEETACRIGRKATGESVRKEYERFMKDN